MDEAQRAFWSVAVQISAVLGLAVVLETRFSAERFKTSSRKVRITESILLLLAALGIGLVGMVAVLSLAADRSSNVLLDIAPHVLSFGFGVLVIIPAAFLIGALNADVPVFVKAFMPWSVARKTRRLAKKLTPRTKRVMSFIEEELKELDRLDALEDSYISSLREENESAKKIAKNPSRYTADDIAWAAEITTNFAPKNQESEEKARVSKKKRESLQEDAEELVKGLGKLVNTPALVREALEGEAEEAREMATALAQLGLEATLNIYRSKEKQSGPDDDSSEELKAPPPAPENS
jgi:hypothetical protein